MTSSTGTIYGYKYNSRIARTILKVIGEIPGEVKYKTVKYPQRMTYYSIRKKVYERLSHYQPPNKPSPWHFDKNINDLIKWNLISKKLDAKRKYQHELTDFGRICNSYDYEPEEYKRFYLIWAFIAFRAIEGVWKNPDGSDPLTSPESIGRYHEIQGITSEDILKYESRIRIPHNLFGDAKFTEDEISDHINLLAKKKILIQSDNNRYFLSSKYYKFVVYVYIFLVRDIQQTMILRWKIISGSKPEERRWYQFWYGNEETKDTTDRYALERSNYKSHLNLKDLRGCRKKIRKLNDQIIRDYDSLKDQSTNELNEIPGFAVTLLSYACTTEIKDLLKKINMKISQ